jgi:hypothetical protein
MEFSEHDRLFLATMCRYFHEHATWPTYDELDCDLSDEHDDLDLVAVGRKLEPFMYEGPYAPMWGWDPSRPTSLSISALHTCVTEGICPEVAEDLDAFMQVVRLCVEKYRTRGTTSPQVTEAEVRGRFRMSDLMARKVFNLCLGASLTSGSSSQVSPEGLPQWTFTVSPYVRTYRRVATIEEFLSARQKERDDQRTMYQSPLPAVSATTRRGVDGAEASPAAATGAPADAGEDGGAVVAYDLVAGTRGYIEKVVRQINKTYDAACYDACAVLVRRLIETLIIEAFEANSTASTIKNPAGEIMPLRDLVDNMQAETSWNLGRNARKALPRLKSVGDKSAHDRRYNARRDDIDKIKDDLRTVVEELIALARLT